MDADVLQAKVRDGALSIPLITSALRLFHAAAERKTCFVAMPFRRTFKKVYQAICEALAGEGWTVVNAYDMVHPHRVTDTIVQGIWTADLLVADVTRSNPNVLYEVGIAHTLGRGTILITQDSETVIDLGNERLIFYQPSERGLDDLKRNLRKFCA
jgi:hypothetical protein